MRLSQKKNQQVPTTPTTYPNETFIETEKGYFYIYSPGKRYRILTKRILDSWAPHRVVRTTEAAVSGYKIFSKMKFRNGSLLYSQASGKMYLVSGHKLRHIRNPDVLDLIGASRSDAVWVSLPEIKLHEEGEPLD